jgi:hypothetical protein
MTLADKRALLSKEHFSVDGTLIQAWASHKSFVRKDGRSDDANGGGGSGGRNAQANWKGKIAADKAYDTRDFIDACRQRRVTPHVAANDTRIGGSAIDGRTTRHSDYAISQMIRKRIEEHFGWGKTIGRIRQTVYRGLRRVDQHFKLASNIVRMARMLSTASQGSDAMRRQERHDRGTQSIARHHRCRPEPRQRDQIHQDQLASDTSVSSLGRNSTAC